MHEVEWSVAAGSMLNHRSFSRALWGGAACRMRDGSGTPHTHELSSRPHHNVTTSHNGLLGCSDGNGDDDE